jgi:hypothetical protein
MTDDPDQVSELMWIVHYVLHLPGISGAVAAKLIGKGA